MVQASLAPTGAIPDIENMKIGGGKNRSLARRLGVALATMLLPLVAVAATGLLTFTASIARFEGFRKMAVAEAQQVEQLKDSIERADDVGEHFVEDDDPASGRRFQALSQEIASGFDGLRMLKTDDEALVAQQARTSWNHAYAAAVRAAASTGDKDRLLDPFHDRLDESVGLLDDVSALNLEEVVAEVAFFGRLERIQLFAALGILLVSSIIAFFLTARVRRSITTPLLSLEEAAREFGSDNLSHRIEITGDDELARVGLALNTMAGKLEQSTTALTESEQQRRRLLGTLLEAGEQERTRLAAELHDGPIQGLARLMYELELACMDAEEAQLQTLSKDLSALQGALGHQVESLRTMMIDLRPPVLDERGLEGAIQTHLDSWASKLPTPRVTVHLPRRLDPSIETVLFRVAQEALVNVAKHAAARKVTVYLAEVDGAVILKVWDDGVGFSSGLVVAGHIGLDSMKERVESAGGTLKVSSIPGSGTTVAVRFEQEEMMLV
jgi:signal transduction histidine kinase